MIKINWQAIRSVFSGIYPHHYSDYNTPKESIPSHSGCGGCSKAKARLKSSDVEGGYKPSPEEMSKTRLDPEKFLLSGDGIFHTIQGEGNWAGRPTTFVRLHICNLACSWCDAWYTWRRDTPEFYSEPSQIDIMDLRAAIEKAQQKFGCKSLVKNITFTGGEPLIHMKQIERWMQANPDFTVQIETNGTLVPTPFLLERAKFNCSPKLEVSDNSLAMRFKEMPLKILAKTNDVCFKFVFRTKEDIDEVIERYSFLDLDQIWMMPEGVYLEEHRKVFDDTVDYLIGKGVNVACRNQCLMWDAAKRGV